MWAEILKALTVYLSSMFKFFLGPIGGKAVGLHWLTTMVVTIAGMMTVVIAFTFFGDFIRNRIINRFRKKKTEETTEPSRSGIVKRFGVAGVAFLTPPLFMPIGGSLIAISLTSNRQKIIFYMLMSAIFWSVAVTCAVYFGYDAFVRWMDKVHPIQ